MYVCWPSFGHAVICTCTHTCTYIVHTCRCYRLLTCMWGIAKWREALYSTDMSSVTTRRIPTKYLHTQYSKTCRCCTTRQSDIITMSTSTSPCQRDQNNIRRVCVTDLTAYITTICTHTYTRTRKVNKPSLFTCVYRNSPKLTLDVRHTTANTHTHSLN